MGSRELLGSIPYEIQTSMYKKAMKKEISTNDSNNNVQHVAGFDVSFMSVPAHGDHLCPHDTKTNLDLDSKTLSDRRSKSTGAFSSIINQWIPHGILNNT